jgi:hypothetical protein
MAEEYVHDVQRFTTAQTFFRANRAGIADAAAIKPEDIAKFNSIVFGPDIELENSKSLAAKLPQEPEQNATQADKISYTLKLLKYLRTL